MSKKKKQKEPVKEPTKSDNPFEKKEVLAALDRILAEGKDALTRTEKTLQDNIDTLVTALMRAMTDPGCEVRLTYKTVSEAACAWGWLLAAAQGRGLVDHALCSAFDVELKNGSGIMFWTEEGRGLLSKKPTPVEERAADG